MDVSVPQVLAPEPGCQHFARLAGELVSGMCRLAKHFWDWDAFDHFHPLIVVVEEETFLLCALLVVTEHLSHQLLFANQIAELIIKVMMN